jgi:L-lactate dehydrogenase complex protein LldG
MTARDEMLARINAATATDGSGPASQSHREYRQRGTRPASDLLDLLAERLVDYRAQVRRTSSSALAQEVSAALSQRGARTIVVPPELDIALPEWLHVTVDDWALGPVELDGFDGVVTRAAVAVAETGTIILDGSAGQGRRAITLMPDYHLCIVAADQVVELVPEAVARLATSANRPLTWISGPSATSDIELERVEGVHGPRTLEVIIAAG